MLDDIYYNYTVSGPVESFKSTLDEVREADILIHVVDISHSDFEE
jgi:50S ribosomal subunit-associated GTPase HflX